ncbi:hypothetical protein [uncultured Croceitalea sp.]|uniref:hypothetical protein n=1 Tax=uncultured Croceitalea sp. TaxID=1798908 RepID=UPI00330580FE
MKILKLLIALCLIVSITSCSKDDNGTTPADAQSIIGTWSLNMLQADIDLSGTFNSIPFQGTARSVGENFDYTITFTETNYTSQGSYDIVTTGTVNGIPLDEDRQTIVEEASTNTYSFNNGSIEFDANAFEFESQDISFSDPSDLQEYDVAFDSNGNLIMTQVIETTVEQDGIPITTSVDARIVLSPVQ